jgi:hypothetical protein
MKHNYGLYFLKQARNGDKLVRNSVKHVYNWHLDNRSESKCVFTKASLNYAIRNDDYILVQKLYNIGLTYNIDDDYDELYNVNNRVINSSLLNCSNIDIWNFILTKGNILDKCHMYLLCCSVFKKLYDLGYFDDRMLHNMLIDNVYKLNKYTMDNLSYVNYKWSIIHCLNIINIENIEHIKYLWRNGNNTTYDQPYKYNKNQIWDSLMVDYTLYDLVVSIEPKIIDFMIDSLLGTKYTELMKHDDYVSIMNYIKSDLKDSYKNNSIVALIIKHHIEDGIDFIDKLDLLRKTMILKYCKNEYSINMYNDGVNIIKDQITL